jgi:eukaryotic-like serine/threonine-protein kinase
MKPGTKLGSYEVLAPLGSGGMGEVYRARDTKLGRDVALKVLPEAFAKNAERMARFEREAKVLASLNHPNIASIYGLEEANGARALVMELVEGPTLAERIMQAPFPLDEALPVAKQIAEGLEYAHERGIIHRDLKPANVKVRPDGTVKILDFGLAKALEETPEAGTINDSPTISAAASREGMILGTAAYMSPEQARGKTVDRRGDIWSFGAVLFEMLSGQQAFPGEDVSHTLAAVIMKEPDWSVLPSSLPASVGRLLRRLLTKDPRQRLRDIGDARISLDEVLSGAPEAAPTPGAAVPIWRRAMPWTLFGVTAIALAALAWVYQRAVNTSAPAQLLRYEVFPPEKTNFGTFMSWFPFDLSPDGRHLAFTATSESGTTLLWVRDLDSLVSRPLPGTDGATFPFWSPDSRTLAFQAGSKLERVEISGGAPQVLCSVAMVVGGSWNQDGVILFGSTRGLMRVSAAGGTASPITKVDHSGGEIGHGIPSFFPDGRHFLYLRDFGPAEGTYLGSLDTGSDQLGSKPLVAGRVMCLLSPGPGPAQILCRQTNGTLTAQNFDVSRGKLEGDPVPIAEGVANYFTVSANGVLAYAGVNEARLQLTWFNRQGKILGTVGEPGVLPEPAISPDGSTVVVPRTAEDGGSDLWLYNLGHGTRSRLTLDRKGNSFPVWSPDGSHIAFVSLREGTPYVYQKAVNGMGQAEAFERTGPRRLSDWSRDGRYLIEEGPNAGSFSSIWVLPLSPEQGRSERNSALYLDEAFTEIPGKVSPDSHWIAYDYDETGRDEIYVGTFPMPSGKWAVSINGGTRPTWSRDGKELYFIGLDGSLMAADVKTGPGGAFQSGAPQALFDPHIGGNRFTWFDVAKDGRFLIPVQAGQSRSSITVLVNWPSLLKK